MYPQMAALLPVIQDSVGDLSDTIANEPLIQSLRSADSVGGLLGCKFSVLLRLVWRELPSGLNIKKNTYLLS